LRARWLPRVWATLAGLAVALAFMVRLFEHGGMRVFEDGGGGGLLIAVVALLASLGAVAFARRERVYDLYIQTSALGTLIVCITATAAYGLAHAGEPFSAFFILTLLVVGQCALAVKLLRAEARRARGPRP
jgi:hypothetical protein